MIFKGNRTQISPLPLALFSSLLVQFAMVFIGGAIVVVIGRKYGPEGLGLFALTISIAMVMATLGSVLSQESVKSIVSTRSYSESAIVGNGMFYGFVFGGVLSLLIAIYCSSVHAKYFAALPDRLWAIAILAIVPLLIQDYYRGFLGGSDASGRLSITVALRDLLLLGILVVSLTFSDISISGVISIWALVIIGSAFVNLILSLVVSNDPPSVNFGLIVKTSSLGMKGYIRNISSVLQNKMEPLLLVLFLAPFDIGLFTIAFTIVLLFSFIPVAFKRVLVRQFELFGEKSGGELAPILIRAMFVSTILLAVMIVPFGKLLIMSLVGAKFSEAYFALLVLLPGSIFYCFTKLLDRELLSEEFSAYVTVISFSNLIISIGISLLLIPRFGIIGLSAAISIASTFSGLLHLHFFINQRGLSLSDVLIPRTTDLMTILRWRD